MPREVDAPCQPHSLQTADFVVSRSLANFLVTVRPGDAKNLHLLAVCPSVPRYFLERLFCVIEDGISSGQPLPAADGDVGVARINLHTKCPPTYLFGRHYGAAGTSKRVEDN